MAAARGLSPVAVSLGYATRAALRLLIAVASLVAKHRLSGTWASVVAAGGLTSCGPQASRPVACGVFLDQGLNSRPLHWQMNSYPLDHQQSPPDGV